MSITFHLKYTDQHEWVAIDDSTATVGITAYAVEALGDIVYVELPEPGSQVAAGVSCGEVESTKSVSDLVSPVGGTVTEINHDVIDDAALVNLEPYDSGWLYRVSVDDLPELMSAAEYIDFIEG